MKAKEREKSDIVIFRIKSIILWSIKKSWKKVFYWQLIQFILYNKKTKIHLIVFIKNYLVKKFNFLMPNALVKKKKLENFF